MPAGERLRDTAARRGRARSRRAGSAGAAAPGTSCSGARRAAAAAPPEPERVPERVAPDGREPPGAASDGSADELEARPPVERARRGPARDVPSRRGSARAGDVSMPTLTGCGLQLGARARARPRGARGSGAARPPSAVRQPAVVDVLVVERRLPARRARRRGSACSATCSVPGGNRARTARGLVRERVGRASSRDRVTGRVEPRLLPELARRGGGRLLAPLDAAGDEMPVARACPASGAGRGTRALSPPGRRTTIATSSGRRRRSPRRSSSASSIDAPGRAPTRTAPRDAGRARRARRGGRAPRGPRRRSPTGRAGRRGPRRRRRPRRATGCAEATTGVPHAIASITGMPKPSNSDG